jgi:hypothetical protein
LAKTKQDKKNIFGPIGLLVRKGGTVQWYIFIFSIIISLPDLFQPFHAFFSIFQLLYLIDILHSENHVKDPLSFKHSPCEPFSIILEGKHG